MERFYARLKDASKPDTTILRTQFQAHQAQQRDDSELVWKEDSLGAETSVSVHIRHLRQKLEINPSEPRYLKVVWGLGYKMEDKK